MQIVPAAPKSMITIHKYTIPGALGKFEVELDIPKGAGLASTGQQSEVPCLWYIVDTEAPTEKKYFYFYATGIEIPQSSHDALFYIGTFHFERGKKVLHLFEKRDALR